ncbi:DUF3048 domain-containing protein [Candidatus Parcubacteria bacterium]|nr:DUF3048 domain-containing protein [Candidatus Parcubacteria bacterium]
MAEFLQQSHPSRLGTLGTKLAAVPKKWRVASGVVLVVVTLLLVFCLLRSSGRLGSGKPSEFLSGLAGTEGSAESDSSRTVEHPISGLWFTAQQAEVWQERRPLAVLINGHADARGVLTGLAEADLVYEAVAEGGIPRLLAIFHTRLPEKVGSVRSARVYHVDWAREYSAWLAHWGAAQIDPNNPDVCFSQADAFSRMRDIYVSSIDAMVVNSQAYFRDENGLAQEHTGFANLPRVLEAGYRRYPDQRRGLGEIASWEFKDDAPEAPEAPGAQRGPVPDGTGRGPAATLAFDFWEIMPGYDVVWEYDPVRNVYLRSQGGDLIKDATTGEPIAAKNVAILFMAETSLGDFKQHILYGTLSGGKALIYRDGQEIAATWERQSVADRTLFVDNETGREVEFNRGSTWLEVLPIGNEVVYRTAVAE